MHYNGDTIKATAFLAAYLAVLFAANSGLTPIHVLWACQTMNIPIVLISKVCNLIIKTTLILGRESISFLSSLHLYMYQILQNINQWFYMITVFTSLHKLFQWKYRPIIGGNMFYALLRFSCENIYFHPRNRGHSYDNNVYVFYTGKWCNSDAASLLLEHRCKEQREG